MTYFISGGLIAHTKNETLFEPTYRFARSRALQVEEISDFSTTLPIDYDEYKFLTNEDGISIYTKDTSILPLLLHGTKSSGKPIKYNKDVKEICFSILHSFEKGFRNMWQDWERSTKDDIYKQQGLDEMFKVIAQKIENEVCD